MLMMSRWCTLHYTMIGGWATTHPLCCCCIWLVSQLHRLYYHFSNGCICRDGNKTPAAVTMATKTSCFVLVTWRSSIMIWYLNTRKTKDTLPHTFLKDTLPHTFLGILNRKCPLRRQWTFLQDIPDGNCVFDQHCTQATPVCLQDPKFLLLHSPQKKAGGHAAN